MSGKNIKAAIIGCGVIAPAHADGYSLIENVEIKWACDLVAEKAAKLSEKFKIAQTCTDYRQVLADPEVNCVSICTDHSSHAQIAVDAMKAGKHLICEKALSSSHDGLSMIFKEREKHPDLVCAGIFQHRFDLTFQYTRKLLQEKVLGKMLVANLRFDCYRSNEYYMADRWRGTWDGEGGSVLINQAIHYVDILAWLCGGVRSLSASFMNLSHQNIIETEDTAAASLMFKEGYLGTLSATCSSHFDWDNTLSFHGTEGAIDLANGQLFRISLKNKEREEQIRQEYAALKERPQLASSKHYYGTSHPAQIADFIDAIRDNRAPFVSIEDARHAVDIVLGIYKSHREKRTVKI